MKIQHKKDTISSIICTKSTRSKFNHSMTMLRLAKSLTFLWIVISALSFTSSKASIIPNPPAAPLPHQTSDEGGTDILCIDVITNGMREFPNNIKGIDSFIDPEHISELTTLYAQHSNDGKAHSMQIAIIFPQRIGTPNESIGKLDSICIKRPDMEKVAPREGFSKWHSLRPNSWIKCCNYDIGNSESFDVGDCECFIIGTVFDETTDIPEAQLKDRVDMLPTEKCRPKEKRDVRKRSWNSLSNGWGKRSDNMFDDRAAQLSWLEVRCLYKLRQRQRQKYEMEKLIMDIPELQSILCDNEKRFLKRCATAPSILDDANCEYNSSYNAIKVWSIIFAILS